MFLTPGDSEATMKENRRARELELELKQKELAYRAKDIELKAKELELRAKELELSKKINRDEEEFSQPRPTVRTTAAATPYRGAFFQDAPAVIAPQERKRDLYFPAPSPRSGGLVFLALFQTTGATTYCLSLVETNKNNLT